MRFSQLAWIVTLIASVCTALVGQAEMIGEPWRHYVTVLGLVATTVSGVMINRPWPTEDKP